MPDKIPNPDRDLSRQIDRERLKDDDITSFTPARRRAGRDDDTQDDADVLVSESGAGDLVHELGRLQTNLLDGLKNGAGRLQDMVADAAKLPEEAMDAALGGIAQVIGGANNAWESGSYDKGDDDSGDDDGDGDSGDDQGGGSNDGGTAGGGDLEGDIISGGHWTPHYSTEAGADFSPTPMFIPTGETTMNFDQPSDGAFGGIDPTAGDGNDL